MASPGRILQPRFGNGHSLLRRNGLGCSLFARRYWGNTYWSLFLRVLRCFTSPGSPRAAKQRGSTVSQCWVTPFGDPGITGCLTPPPGLSQSGHVLHRLLVPRHPPSAPNPWLAINNHFRIFNFQSAKRSFN